MKQTIFFRYKEFVSPTGKYANLSPDDPRIQSNTFDNDFVEMLMHLWQYQLRIRPSVSIPSLLSVCKGKALIGKVDQLSDEDKRECFQISNEV